MALEPPAADEDERKRGKRRTRAKGGAEESTEAWLASAEAVWPMQNTPMYHYGIASAMGYALSMFSETLRDRKLVTLEQDLLILIIGFCFPMVSVVIDGLTYGDAVTISPPEYWALFGNFVPGM